MKSRHFLLSAATALALLAPGPGPAPQAEAAVYWGNGGSIAAANLDGTVPIFGLPYESGVPEIREACGVAVDGGYVYWADRLGGTIGRFQLPTTNSPGERGLVDPAYETVEIDEAFISGLVQPCGVAVDASHLYWADNWGLAIGRANLDGSGVDRTFVSGLDRPCGVAVDGAHIYWANQLGDSIGRAGLGGGSIESEFITGAGSPCGVAVDGAHIYWANEGAGSIGRAGLGGGGIDQSFIGALDEPCGVAANDANVYWAGKSGRVGRANLDGTGVNGSVVSSESYLASCGVALDARTFRPRPLPLSSPFFLGRIRRSRTSAVAFITAKVPDSDGILAVRSKGLAWRVLKGDPPRREGGYLLWTLKVWPAKKGRVAKRIRRQLRRYGRARASLTATYQEVGRRPAFASSDFTLRRPRGPRAGR